MFLKFRQNSSPIFKYLPSLTSLPISIFCFVKLNRGGRVDIYRVGWTSCKDQSCIYPVDNKYVSLVLKKIWYFQLSFFKMILGSR